MNRLFRHLRCAKAGKVCLAAAAYLCLAAGEAQAGCGHHIVILAELSPEQRSMLVRAMLGGGCQGGVQREAMPGCATCPFAPLGQSPCRGPHCSNERPPEGVPVAPPSTIQIDPWSALLHIVNSQTHPFAGYLPPDGHACPIPRIDSIFHPPRAA